MPTVIDSFVAEFTLDPTDFEKGANNVRLNLKRVREDVGKSGKTTDDFGKQGAAALSKLKNEAVGLFLAFQGASSIKGFVSDLLTGDAATGRLAANLGVATQSLSAWQLAVQSVGGDAKDADAAMTALASALQSYKLTGSTGHDTDFRGLGVTLGDLNQGPEQVLYKLAEAAKRMPAPEYFERLTRLGMSPAMINLLRQGRDATQALVDAKRAEGAATDDDAKAAERLQAKLADLKSHILKAVRPAVYDLANELDRVVGGFQDGTLKAPGFSVLIDLLAGTAKNAAKGVGLLATAVDAVGRAWDKVKSLGASLPPWMVALGQWLDENVNPLTRVANAIDWADRALGGPGMAAPSAPAAVRDPVGNPYGAPDLPAFKKGSGFPAKSGSGTRAERNNNPGNIEDGKFARSQPGYAGGDGRFAKFATPEHGQSAMLALLSGKGYAGGGRNTIEAIVSKWAPGHENNTAAYIAAVSKATGLQRNQPLSRGQLGAVAAAMARHEGYGKNTPRLASSGGNSGGGSNVTIGTIVVNAPHADPKKVAAEIPEAMKRRGIVARSNRGLS